jgi:hypothetical protein
MVAALASLLGGCAGIYQARSMNVKEPLLVNMALLKEGGSDQMLYRYVHPTAKVKDYPRMIIDPVLISKESALDATAQENYQKLANNAYVILNEELKKDFEIVNSVERGTMRLQMAIIDADSSKPVRNLLSSALPIGMA